MGELQAPVIYFTTPGLSSSYGPGAAPVGTRGLRESANPESGPWVFVFRSEALETAWAGARKALFFDDWYFRVHLIPGALALGSFSEATTQNFTIWNTHLTDVNLTAATWGAGDQELTFNASIPLTFGPLRPIIASVTAAANGSEAISDTLSLDFDTSEVRSLGVTGLRVTPPEAILWPYMPNWSQPIKVDHEFKTDILVSRNGTETNRRAVRQTPRKKVSMSNVVRPDQLRDFRRMISQSHRGTFIVPDWTRRTATVGAVSNSLTIDLDNAADWVVADQWLVLRSGEQVVQRQIKSVDVNEVTFWTLDDLDWPEGTSVYPGLVCELEDDVNVKRVTSSKNLLSTVFQVVPGSEAEADYGAAQTIWDGRELFMFRPNWATSQSVVLGRPSELVDYMYGVRDRFTPNAVPQYRVTQAFVGRDASEAESLRRFYGRMRGQQGEFFMPTYENDLTPHLDLDPDPAKAVLRTEGPEDFVAFSENAARRSLLVILTDGTKLFRVVSSVEYVDDVDGQSTQFNLTEPWPQDIPVEDIEQVCWVPLWRLSSDLLSETWLTNSVVQVQLTMQTQQYQPSES